MIRLLQGSLKIGVSQPKTLYTAGGQFFGPNLQDSYIARPRNKYGCGDSVGKDDKVDRRSHGVA